MARSGASGPGSSSFADRLLAGSYVTIATHVGGCTSTPRMEPLKYTNSLKQKQSDSAELSII